MRIANSSIDLSSTHLAAERSTRQESLRTWVGERRPDFEALEGRQNRRPGSQGQDGDRGIGSAGNGEDRRATDARRVAGLALRLGQQAAAQMRQVPKEADLAPKGTDAAKDGEDELETDPKSLVIKLLVEAMTGRKIKVVSLDETREALAQGEAMSAEVQQAAQGQQRAGWGVEYDYHESHHEIEQTTFQAQGVVKTADGKEIAFSYEMEMSREFYSETNVSIRAGDAILKDPLVINFGGTAAQLTDQKFAFDLDADGTQDRISWVKPGSGFLALDKDGNGSIDDGSELFGAKTGDGFAELAAYDDDRNGWIDEADAVYSQLQVWSKSGTTDQLASLKDRNVGAIYLGKQTTPFELKDGANALQGAVRSSGIYVKEDGSGVGSVQQVDLAV